MGELMVVNKSRGSEAERILAQLGGERVRTQDGRPCSAGRLYGRSTGRGGTSIRRSTAPKPATVEQSGPLKATGLLRRKSNTNCGGLRVCARRERHIGLNSGRHSHPLAMARSTPSRAAAGAQKRAGNQLGGDALIDLEGSCASHISLESPSGYAGECNPLGLPALPLSACASCRSLSPK